MCEHLFAFSWLGHEEALSRFTLKKLLLLVCFLDKAKESRLIEHNPCLFCLDAEFKVGQGLPVSTANIQCTENKRKLKISLKRQPY